MKIIKTYDRTFEPVILCASKDETRVHLNHLRNQDGFLYSCDGHRFFASKNLYRPNLEGKSIRTDVFASSFEMIEASENNYPDIEKILPFGEKSYQGEFKVPLWLEKFKKLQDTKKNNINLTFTEEGILEIGRSTSQESGSISVNGRLISPLYGMECQVGWNGPYEPMVFSNNETDNLWNNDWFMVVMPIRLEKSPPLTLYFDEEKEENIESDIENVIPF